MKSCYRKAAAEQGAVRAPVRLPPRPAALLAAALATGVACGPAASGDDTVTLSVGYSAPVEQGVATGLNQMILELTLDSLIRSGPDGSIEPQLARAWVVAADGRSVDLALRDDISFHDGSRVTAEDVKATLEGLRRIPSRGGRIPVLEDIDSITIPEPHRVIIKLSKPSGQLLLYALGVRIERTDEDGQSLVTGPFYVESRTRDRTTLRANPHYFPRRSDIDVVNLITYPTLRMAWAAMMRSEVDFLFNVPIEAREFVQADSTVQIFSRDTPYAYALLFNARHPPFDDARLRVALSHAVDREAIIDRAFRGHGSVASGIWRDHQVYGGQHLDYSFDPHETIRLLDEIGLPHPTDPSEGDQPARLTFRALVGDDQPRFEPIALLLQQQLRRIGVEMEIDARPFAEIETMFAGNDWDAVLVPANLARNLSRLYLYWHSSQLYAISGFRGADDALDALRTSTTEAATRQAAQRVQSILFEQAPAIFVASLEETRAVSRRFIVPDEPGLDVMETLWRWQVAPDWAGSN